MAPDIDTTDDGAIDTAFGDDGILPSAHDQDEVVPETRCGDADMAQLKAWNSPAPQEVNTCVHHVIQDWVRDQPERPAVCAWDGDFSYAEIDDLASKLSAQLQSFGVAPEVYVPIYSEKSKWVVVAMLSVMKAGGAFVLLDPSYPDNRLKEICATVSASVIVASKEMAEKASELASHVLLACGPPPKMPQTRVKPVIAAAPSNALYAVFTSGTSGKPKGIATEHKSFCSSAMAHSRAISLDSRSRVLQFASYAFDCSLLEIITTLLVGACVCIPSETGRLLNLAEEMRRLRPNWACLTPSVAHLLQVTDLPALDSLLLAGEPIREADLRKWGPQVKKLFVAYGPSECAVCSTARASSVEDVHHTNLGHGVGVACWIVNPADHEQLLPIGAVGELVLDGPPVGRGYIGDPDRTAEVFIQPPSWHRQLYSGGREGKTQLYKTGDLVRYDPKDGSIFYIGRKDMQVKFHGQRLEVADVEHHLRSLLHSSEDVVVEMMAPRGFDTLVAFIKQRRDASRQNGLADDDSSLVMQDDKFRIQARSAQQQLERLVPKWMIPSLFLPVTRMPLTMNGKRDRPKLRSLVTGLDRLQLRAYESLLPSAEKRQPSTSMEQSIQRLWANILNISPNEIGLDDGFFDLGGNSINAMKLAGAARREGLELTMNHLYDNTTLAGMARWANKSTSCKALVSIPPFSLLPEDEDMASIIEGAMQQCQLRDKSLIEDVYPCTPLQEGLMSLTAKRPGAYTIAIEYELSANVDVRKFKQAWDDVMTANPILRTRVVQASTGRLYQVVLKETSSWDSGTNQSEAINWTIGGSLIRPYLQYSKSKTWLPKFKLLFHHALIDGWARPLIFQQLDAAYNGSKLAPRPFNLFIEYVLGAAPRCESFWKDEFENLEAAAFPPLPSATYTPEPSCKETISIPVDFIENHTFSVPNRLKLTWAILLSLYTGSSDTVYGLTVTGRGAPVLSIEEMTGPTIATIPYRLRVKSQCTIESALQQVQEDAVRMIPFEQAGLPCISRLGPDAASACRFQSILVIQPKEDDRDPPPLFHSARDLATLDAFSTYVITLICRESSGSVEVEATFDPGVVGEIQLVRMLRQLRHIFLQLIPSRQHQLIRDIDTTSPEDWSEITQWNKALPPPVVACAHELIRKQSDLQPDAPAVCAWDGGFTYREMEQLSSYLANCLIDKGVGPEVFVPLYFEKSCWTTIAMLGVIKAGGAFILLEPSHPLQRLQQICRDAKAPLVISSETNLQMARGLAPKHIVLSHNRKPLSAKETSPPLPNVSPSSSMYAVFTSGSTGTAKGAVHSHISWCTSAQANRAGLYLDPNARVFQFASYAFDISIADNLLTLVAGGCVCVPSEKDRKDDVAGAINALGANWACLTPSVAQIIDPDTVSCLKKLSLGGEAISPEIISQWAPRVHLLNIYGPAECAILTTLHQNVRDPKDPNNIGFPTSAVCWVVDIEFEQRIAPVGAVGELFVESPIVGNGYLNDPGRTAACFIPEEERPSWLSKFRPKEASQLYRTGDLVQYTPDGSLRFVGRKDTQVKLRGQRVELGEIEHQLRRCFANAKEAVAEIVVLGNGRGKPVLVAFILIKKDILAMPETQFRALATEATIQLERLLPIYMVPSMFVPVDSFPYTKSGKLDRKRLRTLAAQLSPNDYNQPAPATKSVALPATGVEFTVHDLFAQILKIQPNELSIHDQFFRQGGDSILAMKLVAMAKEREYLFTAADVFKHPTASLLSKVARRLPNTADQHIEPFSLLSNDVGRAQLEDDAAALCEVERNQIEDIYPCTPLQEGLVALAIKTPGKYIARFKYLIAPETDLDRFKEAWAAVMAANSVLRTRVVHLESHGIFQVVLKESASFKMHDTAKEQWHCSESITMGLGSQLMYMSIAPLEKGSRLYRFLWTVHHALFDGWSLQLMQEQFKRAYRRNMLPLRTFNRFIRHTTQQKGGEEFWKSRMDKLNATQFPSLPHLDYTPNPDQSIVQSVTMTSRNGTGHTLSTMIQLAWAILLSYHTDSDDVVFGLTVNGRTAALEGIEKITGPTIATVPVRVLLPKAKTVAQALSDLQQQTIAAIPFLQHGLQHIRKISEDTAKACDFQTQLVVQPAEVLAEPDLDGLAVGEPEDLEGYAAFADYAFVMACHMQEGSDGLQIAVNYDAGIFEEAEARRMVEGFGFILDQLASGESKAIGELEMVSPQDMAQLAEWNGQLPPAIEQTLHDLVLHHSRARPDAEAVWAWDGHFTYQELDDWSSRLAQHLVLSLGIEQEANVAVCLEKSCWSIVAILAVLRAGCACVLVDPQHPVSRIEQMLRISSPRFVLVSEVHVQHVQGIQLEDPRLVAISSNFIQELQPCQTKLPTVLPSAAAVILFTSGSTGTPKAIILEHVNLSTDVLACATTMNACTDTRSLHFASYAFDGSIYEIFITLSAGGCLHIPSEYDRMNNLSLFIHDQRVNWAIAIPSTMRVLEAKQLPSLSTIILGGEPVTRMIVDEWADKVHLVNGYGPAEATICAAGVIPSTGWRYGTVGHMKGGVGWIVDASNPARLAAIGTVGELVIEGPVVSRGYLGDAQRTAEAYIASPPWWYKFRPTGTQSRLYKSGDLARYNPDGSIRLVGRKDDAQRKLRGQRLELEEVEYHLRKCFPTAVDIVADVIIPCSGGKSPFLVAYVWMGANHVAQGVDETSVFMEPSDSFRSIAESARTEVSALVPKFMVPELILPLRRHPLNSSGKMDRRKLREAGASLSDDQIVAYSSEGAIAKRPPSGSIECSLQRILAQVLKMDVESVGADDNFFRLGGDSISAMQVVAQCAAAGINITVASLFRDKTIAKMSSHVKQKPLPISTPSPESTTQFDLSPVQKMFLDIAGQEYNHFNQTRSFRVSRSLPTETIQRAIRWIATNHSMFRARFVATPDGDWAQYVTTGSDPNYRYEEHKVATRDQAASLIASDQRRLDIQKGPLFICHLIQVRDDYQQYLAFTIHHLIIDTASWQVLLSDIEPLLAGRNPPLPPPLSFQSWCGSQAIYASEKSPPADILSKCVPQNLDEYWGDTIRGNCWGDSMEEGFTLSEQHTRMILGASNNAYGTQPVEIIHATLLQAFAQTFTDRSVPAIFCEENNREPCDFSIDPSRTIGWLTTVWPADIEVCPEDDLGKILRKTKDTRRSMQLTGCDYFASRYLHPKGVKQPPTETPLEVMFKYSSGLRSQSHDSILEPFSLMNGELAQMSPNLPRLALVDVLAEVRGAHLVIDFIFNRNMQHPQTSIHQWIENAKHCLESASSMLCKQDRMFTLVDFPLLKYSYTELDEFVDRVASVLQASSHEVDDAYPTSPTQQGMLMSQSKNSMQYMNRWIWKVKSSKGFPVHPDQFINAWHQVLRKHPLLRTVLFKSPRRPGHYDQLVLREPPQELCLVLPSSKDPLKRLQDHQFDIPEMSPPQRLVLCASPSGDLACMIEMSHAIIDGTSRQLLERDLRLAFDGRMDAIPFRTYKEYIAYINGQPLSEATTYWEDYLGSLQSCMLLASPPYPLSDVHEDQRRVHNLSITFGQRLRGFCRQHELTLASVFQLAWAMVLRVYLNSDSICFGYMTSGRDVPISDIDSTIGPFVNFLIYHVQFGTESVLDLLHRNQARFVQSLAHQYFSKADQLRAAKWSDESTLLLEEVHSHYPTEYDLEVHVDLFTESIDVSWEYTKAFMSDEQVQNIADAFQMTLLGIISKPHQSVKDVDTFGDLNKERIKRYNQLEAVPVNELVDELVRKRCVAQPSAIAIEAWDGTLSYEQLDALSSLVAIDLRERGVKSNQAVALCFEKSRWTVVALLGVLKAGGAFMLLDPSHPTERLKRMCKSAGPKLILTSSESKNIASKLVLETLVISEEIVSWKRGVPSANDDARGPNDIAYIHYTSGSTGEPKGAMIQHVALSTSAVYHGKAVLMDTDSRVLQFASYSFDVAIAEQVTTLMRGGCVCIPSDAQRHNIARSVADFQANWLLSTPSVLRTLDPTDFMTLRTIVCGGELITEKELGAWRSHVNFIACYGPTECTIISSAQLFTAEIHDGRRLGQWIGCTAWVVSPDDVERLVPIGAIGELLLDGPTVGVGYVNNPERTTDAFISPPSWMRNLKAQIPKRVYKTGDLVRYMDNGVLYFVSRKDSQIKLRGQRVELGEVEHHLQAAFPDAENAVADVVTPLGDAITPMLVAFVSCEKNGNQAGDERKSHIRSGNLFASPNAEFSRQTQMAELYLTRFLPNYMVPVIYIPVRYMPLNSNGKVDRKQLRASADSLNPEELRRYDLTALPAEMPRTENERSLQRIWARVLDKDVTSISIHTNFFRLGGDSLSAMQVVSLCAAERLDTTVADIFHHKTIAQLSASIEKSSVTPEYPTEETGTQFALTPIQKLLFDLSLTGHHHLHQSLYLELLRDIPFPKLDEALHHLVETHSMLRARFTQSEAGDWMQVIEDDVPGSYRCQERVVRTIADVNKAVSQAELAIDFQHGPMLVAELLHVSEKERHLFLVAHRLVIDLVSWRIILEDLEEYLTTGSIQQASLSFQTWCGLQADYAATYLDPDISRLDTGIPRFKDDYWGINGRSNSVKDAAEASFTLNEKTTRSLLQDANQAFSTKPQELFQAALIFSFAQVFCDRQTPALWNEDHGRESWNSHIDLSRTVGWFTTLWPLYVPAEQCSLMEVIRQTKDQRRSVASNGWAHFTSSLHPKAQQLSDAGQLKEVTLNFLGGCPQLERSKSLLRIGNKPTARSLDVSEEMGRFSLVDVVIEPRGKYMCVGFHFNKHMAAHRPIYSWIKLCEQTLVEMAERLPQKPIAFSLSDFPLMPFTYAALDKLLTSSLTDHNIQVQNVEDIYPCSPIQRGILLSQSREAQSYQAQIVWKVVGKQRTKTVDTYRVIDAWQQVVKRHSILRTVFFEGIFPGEYAVQLVLKNAATEIITLPVDDESNLLSALSRPTQLSLGNGRLPYRLTLGQSLTGDVLCGLEISHVIYDGTAKDVLLDEIERAYDGSLPQAAGPAYRDYILYLSKKSEEDQKTFWETHLEGVEPCNFPPMATRDEPISGQGLRSVRLNMKNTSALRNFCTNNGVALLNVIQIAWALILKAYTNSDDVCFGYTSAGRDVPIPGIQEAMGPFINMLVFRMILPDDASVKELLQKNHDTLLESLKYQHYPLSDILRGAKQPDSTRLFNTAVSLHHTRHADAETRTLVSIDGVGGEGVTEYDISVDIQVAPERIEVQLVYCQSIMSKEMAETFADTFSRTIQELTADPSTLVGEINMVGGFGLPLLRNWSGTLPPTESTLLHEAIRERCLIHPARQAVNAWDGEFTYGEVDDLSNKLASYLARHHDVGPDHFIPVCLEKSRWTAIAILAIMKTGSAFTLLDPSLPTKRQRAICQIIKASVIITSLDLSGLANGLAQHIVTVGDRSRYWIGIDQQCLPISSASDIAFAVPTSGSTGEPKVCITEHGAFATNVKAHNVSFDINQDSRVLQFSSYTFGASIAEQVSTLMAGGCICVPSEVERKQSLPEAVARMQANWVLLTPSVARMLDPKDFPSLKTMVIGGDLISQKELDIWRNYVNLYTVYGSAESAIYCAAQHVGPRTSGRDLGAMLCSRSWIVNPSNHELLTPIGAVGELLLEGPSMARGYSGEPERTGAVFIQHPSWLKKMENQRSALYKTGDLVRYNTDGLLRFISRKDNQVKIRGQRLELGEVEHHVRRCFPHATDVIVELVTTGYAGSRGPALVAFIYNGEQESPNPEGLFAQPSLEFRFSAQQAEAELNQVLPGYMVPTLYLPLQRLPLNANAYDAPPVVKRQPANGDERKFRAIFAQILDLSPEGIGMEDNFFRLGGDSLMAIALIQKAREIGSVISMADIFGHPKLCDLARVSIRAPTALTSSTIEPFALVNAETERNDLIASAAKYCQVPDDQVEDIYPCTPLQEGMAALSSKRAGDYVAKFMLQLNRNVDIERFVAAWDAVVNNNPILRTRIINLEGLGTLQVVIRDLVSSWTTFEDAEACETRIKAINWDMGHQLVHLFLVRPDQNTSNGFVFHMHIHHALYDGASMSLLWAHVQAAYDGESPSPSPYNRFIEYTLKEKGAASFWRSEFEGLDAPVFPPLPSSRYIPIPNSTYVHTIFNLETPSMEYSISTLMRLAWAVVMSCYTDSEDVFYGVTVNGRNAPVVGIESVTGPTFATFPVRIHVGKHDTVQSALASVQQRTISAMPFEQFGLQNIRQLSQETALACDFQSHLVIQTATSYTENELVAETLPEQRGYQAFSDAALAMICHLPEKGKADFLVHAVYDEHLVQKSQAVRIVQQFEHILRQLCQTGSQSLRLDQLELVSPQDWEQLSVWNPVVPPSYEACLHDLILRHTSIRPGALAISAWDGDMTYQELDSSSAVLAQYLQAHGIRQGSIVPLIFDRSKWVPVSMLALYRIGAACLNIDPTHPIGRIRDILDRTEARYLLVSPSHQESMVFDNLTTITIPIPDEKQLPKPEKFIAPSVDPHDAAFVIMTSGSTGKPKAIIMEHANLANSIFGYSDMVSLSPCTRGLHFASYAFDASIYETLSVLIHGGCLCIPSEFDRLNNIAEFINRHAVNWTIFTPSFLALLEPDSIPTVSTIILGGEPLTQEIARTWAPKVDLFNMYGPAEATICAGGRVPESGWKQGTMGYMTAGAGWITMPSDPSRLAPIGVPGELLIEGPVVSRGYLGDIDKTAAAYLQSLPWLRPFRPEETESRVYRSGDIVQYNSDGTLRYLGRQDMQVKLRGQRIELGDVEHHVRNAFPGASNVVVELVVPLGGEAKLVAFILFDTVKSESRSANSLVIAPTDGLAAQVAVATRQLVNSLPSYMVPAAFLEVSEIPRAVSGKADRQRLRREAANLSQSQIQELSNTHTIKRQPATDREKLLTSLWGKTLKADSADIGADDDFFHLGGDSISAMRLVGSARREGYHLAVADVFAHPVLSELSKAMRSVASIGSEQEYQPGSLLGIANIRDFFEQHFTSRVPHYTAQDVEDILPTTELQNSLITGRNITYSRLVVPVQVDLERLEASCRALLRKHAILRTVFAPHNGDMLQIVLRNPSLKKTQLVETAEDLWDFSEKYCTQDASSSPVPFGSLHFQSFLLSHSKSAAQMIVLKTTHAQYDAVSFPLLSEDLISAYKGHNLLASDSLDFAHYLRYRAEQSTKKAFAFWREYLAGAEMTEREAICRRRSHKEAFLVKSTRQIPIPSTPEGVTLASLVKAAWAVVLAKASKKKDVVFGHIINGRDASLLRRGPHLGPMHNDFADNYLASMPYANIDFRNIVQNSTGWAPEVDFGSIHTHQDANLDLSGRIEEESSSSSSSLHPEEASVSDSQQWRPLQVGFQHHLHAVTWPVTKDKLLVQLNASSRIMHSDDAEQVHDQFCELIAEFSRDPLLPLQL
ncbi:mitochondrial membrane protein [Apiospora arundinis]